MAPAAPAPMAPAPPAAASTSTHGALSRATYTCAAALRHASQDHTRLYLSLLPSELCVQIDRLGSWLYSGVPKPLELPKNFVRDPYERFVRIVSAEGEQVLVYCGNYNGREVHILRPDRPSGDPRRLFILPELKFNDVDEGQPTLVACSESSGHIRIYDLDGYLVSSGPPIMPTVGPWRDGASQQKYRDGWLVSLDQHYFRIRHPDQVFRTDFVFDPLYTRDVIVINGEPMAVQGRENNMLQVWDLRTCQMRYETAIPRYWFLKLHTNSGVFCVVQEDGLVVHNLVTKNVILPHIMALVYADFSRSVLILNKLTAVERPDAALELDLPLGNVIRYWDVQYPDRICQVDFCDWAPLQHRTGQIVVAQRDAEYLYWHLGLGCGVRTNVLCEERMQVCFANGALFFISPNNVMMVPLLHSDANFAAARSASPPELIQPRDVHGRSVPYAAARRVPTDVPFVKARTVFTAASSYDVMSPVVELRDLSPEAHMLPPLFSDGCNPERLCMMSV